jgi:hypothetical protein
MATTTYRYLFADLLTNVILAELPVTGVSFTQQLNSAGTLQGHLLLSGINATQQNVANATIPGRTVIYVDRNGVLVWGGIIWSREYNSNTQLLSFNAREFLSYFEHRRITTTNVFTNQDQIKVALNLIQGAASIPYGNIGLLYNQDPLSQGSSGVLVSRTYYSYELKSVLSAIQDLSKQTNGFDFAIDVYYDGDANPAKSFNTYYPRNGEVYSSTSATAPVLQFPAGNIIEYTYPEDGSITANTLYALGAGSNEGKLISIATDSTKFAAGWAVLEDQANYSDVTDATVLAGLAIGQINAVSYPPTTLTVTVPPFIDPTLGTYEVSDDVRVIIRDDRFPTGLDAIYRLVALTVQPGENGPERATLTLTTGTTS